MFYTYIHATPNGDVFYVGKGTGRRVYSMRDRTIHWKQIVEKNDGVMMRIVKRFEKEEDAFEYEQILIKEYKSKGCELVNMTEGGKGPLGYCQSEELRNHKSKLQTGYKYPEITCNVCGETGGETAMKRWHFDKCTGAKPKHKIRATIFGKRVYLGKEHTKEKADIMAKEFFDFVMGEASSMTRQTWMVV